MSANASFVRILDDSGPRPLISVVVSTYRRVPVLRRVLEHLARQDLPFEHFDVVVSDDGSPDDTAAMVAEMRAQAPYRLGYLRHENAGPGYTENRGIEAARAPLVLLLADDIFLAPSAVRTHLEMHQAHPEPTVAVLGKVVQAPDLDQSEFLRKWNPFRFDELEDREVLPPYRFGAMFLSVKRDFLLQKGLFNEKKGRAGAAAMEDLELGYRLSRQGMRLLYAKNALAYHYHVTTLEVAAARWYERGLNYGEFRRLAADPEISVYFHVLDWRTCREYARVLAGPNWFRGAERSFAWHVVRHFARIVILNRVTARLFWRPFFELAEKSRTLARLVTPKMYRAFLYYHFLRGVHTGRRLYGD
jgi:GT2 family glycosyltransferase